MIKEILVLPLLLVLVSGCARYGARESVVVAPNGEEYRVLCQSDGKVEYKQGDIVLCVDNRGRPGFLEQVFGALVVALPSVKEVAD